MVQIFCGKVTQFNSGDTRCRFRWDKLGFLRFDSLAKFLDLQ